MAGDCSASASCTAHCVVATQSAIELAPAQPRRVAVQAADRKRQVALLALGGNAGRRAAAHHVDNDDRHFGTDRHGRLSNSVAIAVCRAGSRISISNVPLTWMSLRSRKVSRSPTGALATPILGADQVTHAPEQPLRVGLEAVTDPLPREFERPTSEVLGLVSVIDAVGDDSDHPRVLAAEQLFELSHLF